MDKGRIAGSLKQLAGAAKQSVGRAFGDQRIEAKGTAERAEGKAQNAIGGLKDMARGLLGRR